MNPIMDCVIVLRGTWGVKNNEISTIIINTIIIVFFLSLIERQLVPLLSLVCAN